jgi:hypothetical protein
MFPLVSLQITPYFVPVLDKNCDGEEDSFKYEKFEATGVVVEPIGATEDIDRKIIQTITANTKIPSKISDI